VMTRLQCGHHGAPYTVITGISAEIIVPPSTRTQASGFGGWEHANPNWARTRPPRFL